MGLRNRLKLKSMRECLQDKRRQWFGHLKRMKESAWSSKRSNVVPSRLVVVSPDKVSKDIAKDRNGWKLFIRNRPTLANMGKRC